MVPALRRSSISTIQKRVLKAEELLLISRSRRKLREYMDLFRLIIHLAHTLLTLFLLLSEFYKPRLTQLEVKMKIVGSKLK